MTPLEAYVISMTLGISMKIVYFIIGYLVVRLGHNLLVLGVTGKFTFSAKWSNLNVGLASVSPGLLFVILGCAVIAFGIYTEKEVTVEAFKPLVIESKERTKPTRFYPPKEAQPEKELENAN